MVKKVTEPYPYFDTSKEDRGTILVKAGKIETRQVSSMIHSARPVMNIVFTLFCFARFEKWGKTDGHLCAKTMISAGIDCGSAEWIRRIKFGK